MGLRPRNVLAFAAACLLTTHPKPLTCAAVPPPIEPGIFGVGFTNVTDSSARLVFTTSIPMSARIDVMAGDEDALHLTETSPAQIHHLILDRLSKQKAYRVLISATGDGATVASAETNLRLSAHSPSHHKWPGYTIFGSTLSGNTDDPAAMDLLARSGVRMARVEMSWDRLNPQKGRVDQAYFDQILRQLTELKKRGIEPLVVLDYCVPWAKPYTDRTMTWRNKNFGPPDDIADWKRYVRTVIMGVRGIAHYYEIWNEPDPRYLASRSPVERSGVPVATGREPLNGNWQYWIGDRYAPMISAVREVMDELQPDAVLMNGGWNHDYSGQRGDLLFQRGAGSALDVYAFHAYSPTPSSFSRWYQVVEGGFRKNIDRIFTKNHVQMPLAVTEWGWPAWDGPQPSKGFVTFGDAKLFYVKSTFYLLNAERFELLSQFCLGLGSPTRDRDRDPLYFMLVNESEDGKPLITPVFRTFQWLADTFGSKTYRALPVKVADGSAVRAFAIQLEDSHDVYLAAWQDGSVDKYNSVTSLPMRLVTVSIADLQAGEYSLSVLNVDGEQLSRDQVASGPLLSLQVQLPPATNIKESGVFLARFTRTRD